MKAQSQGEQKPGACYHSKYFRAAHGLCNECPCKTLEDAEKSFQNNKGEQPEQEIVRLVAKYKKYIDNIEWHIRTNKPPEVEIKKLNAQIEYYNEMISDLRGIPAQPSKVQEKDRYWIDQYILRGEKIIEMDKEIQRLKELITGQAYSIWKGCGSDLSFDEWNKQFISGNNL